MEIWTEKFGKETAAIMFENYKEKHSKRCAGEGNPMYGKPSPKGAGNGWKGWYKEVYFRSLREVSYLIYLDKNNILWTPAEKKEFTIHYLDYKGDKRTYRPDFLVNGNILVEIKPKRLHNSPTIQLKAAAAIDFCNKHNLKYELVDFPINANDILEKLIYNEIKFDRDYKEKFLNYIKRN